MTPSRWRAINALHNEFEHYGMLDGAWGIQAHEHRAHLVEYIVELQSALVEAMGLVETNHAHRGICPDGEHEMLRAWAQLVGTGQETGDACFTEQRPGEPCG